jgi:hypothetical protein
LTTDMYSMPAPAVAVRTRAQASMWAVPQHGIRMPFPARQLDSIVGVSNLTCTTTANAAQGATKGAQGDEAFEDPV